jgi:hypothetical protein
MSSLLLFPLFHFDFLDIGDPGGAQIEVSIEGVRYRIRETRMGGRKGSGRCPPTGAASVNIPRCGVRLVAGGTAWGDERERRHGSGGRFWFSASVVILRVFTLLFFCL